MPIGRVKWYSLEKGFGFISSEEGEDVYLASSARDPLNAFSNP